MKRGVVAGLSVESDRPLPGLSDGGLADGTLEVRHARGAGEDRLSGDGRRLELWGDGDLPERLRWFSAHASVRQRRLVLHASAVSLAGRAWAFVGGSGAGKSTLARALEEKGPPLSDDLLPVREREGRWVVLAERSGSAVPLGGLLFLEPRLTDARAGRLEALSASACVEQLCRHGFAELADDELLAWQFERYCSLAESAPAWSLSLPDDLERLPAEAERLRSYLEALEAA